ncbi:glycine cleavage system protein T [Shewanella colwelliana]|uniref:Glycine cleavage system protein T n=1 Tax=Shewanella colwelliana TaxID=23 RepID=A0A1E5IUL3_SHECO|nr:tRNA-modifying protein YgfZ [Shewanella colwelliana]OEG74195.1 glycine cleavage system protein T [Shewanella colwelliana]
MTLTVSQPQWSVTEEMPALVFSHLSHLGLLSVTGEQGRSFIHGQVTTDITSLSAEQWMWGAHCDPKGKMLASFRAFSMGDALMLMQPKDTLAVDLPQLAKYAVFSKADLTDASDEWTMLGVAGAEAKTWVETQFGEISAQLTEIPNGVVLKDGERYIIIVATQASEILLSEITQPIYSHTLWQILEIKAGYPNIAASHQGQFVPQMCNLQAVNGISFNKGCYMGQETVARMKYRGGNKRALYILTGTASDPITLETKLELALEDGYKKTGTIIEVAQTGEHVVLTAVLPNDTQNDAALRVEGDEASSLTIRPLPYSLDEVE